MGPKKSRGHKGLVLTLLSTLAELTHTADIKSYIRVAIMGCVVNGPGEAKEADLGIAVGKNSAVLFRKGEIIGRYSKSEMIDALLDETLKIDKIKQSEDSD